MEAAATSDWTCPVCSGTNPSHRVKCEQCGFCRVDIEILSRVRAGRQLTAFDAEEWHAVGMELRDPAWKQAYFKAGLDAGNALIYSVALRGLRSINREIPGNPADPLIFKRCVEVPRTTPATGVPPRSPVSPIPPAKEIPPGSMPQQGSTRAGSPESRAGWLCPVCFASNGQYDRCSRCGLYQEDCATIIVPREMVPASSLSPEDAERWYLAGTHISDFDFRILFYKEGLELGHPEFYSRALRGINSVKRARGPSRKQPPRTQSASPSRQRFGNPVRPSISQPQPTIVGGEERCICAIIFLVVLIILLVTSLNR